MRYLYISLLLIASLPSIVKGQIITTVAGNGTAGYSGDGGLATNAELHEPYGIAFDVVGNLYFADEGNHRIRKINTAGIISTYAGNGTAVYSGDGGQATAAGLNIPGDLAFDVLGNLYFVCGDSNRIRMINTSGIINTVVGNGMGAGTLLCCFSGDGGQATAAELNAPLGITFDAANNMYISDTYNNRVRKVNTSGIISTIAGSATRGFSGDGGQATVAELNLPTGITVDAAGNLYIADEDNNRIRMINTLGIINTIAGNGTAGYSGDGGQATNAELNNLSGLAVDAVGNLYISDKSNNRIRKVNTVGMISTIVGNGTGGYSGDGGLATAAELYWPLRIIFDPSGNLYISDIDNNRIRKVTNVTAAGIEQFANSNEQVMVYPNPASTSLTLTLSKAEGTCSISIYDMLGKVVMQHAYSPPSERQGEAIDVSDLSEGVYNILIQNSEFKSNKRLVIVR